MSSVTLHTVKCPNCNHEQEVERWNSVNDYDKDKFLSIVDKSIFTYECKIVKKQYYHHILYCFIKWVLKMSE